MAARRISKSAIDWVAFAERVPENQKSHFQAFKAKSDAYLRRVYSLPENPPAIDWGYYRSHGVPVALADQFEKQYATLKVPYPKEDTSPQIDAQQKEAEKTVTEFVKQSNERIANFKKELERWNNIIPFEQMTMEDFANAFPEYAFDPINRPTQWPHDEEGSHLLGPQPQKTE